MNKKQSQPNKASHRPLTRKPLFLMSLVLLSLTLSQTARADDGLDAQALENWQELKSIFYKNQTLLNGHGFIKFTTPYRAKDDRQVPFGLKAKFPGGAKIKQVSMIIDKNPVPMSAEFVYAKGQEEVDLHLFMRMNAGSPVHAVVALTDGRHYVVGGYVKTSGLGACAAPPVGDPLLAMKTLGNMSFAEGPQEKVSKKKRTQVNRMAKLSIKHPNLTGLQIDQITLQHIQAHYISDIDVFLGKEQFMKIRGSISISENPNLRFSYRLNGSSDMGIGIADTKRHKFFKRFPIGAGS